LHQFSLNFCLKDAKAEAKMMQKIQNEEVEAKMRKDAKIVAKMKEFR